MNLPAHHFEFSNSPLSRSGQKADCKQILLFTSNLLFPDEQNLRAKGLAANAFFVSSPDSFLIRTKADSYNR